MAPGVRSGPRGSFQVQRVLAVGSEDTVSSSSVQVGGVRSRLRQLHASHGTNSDATTNRNAKPRRGLKVGSFAAQKLPQRLRTRALLRTLNYVCKSILWRIPPMVGLS